MIARALRFAWLRVRREPGRTALGVLGVTAIGALLFDMLLLSNGLLVSFRDRLDRSGFDVRVMGSESAGRWPGRRSSRRLGARRLRCGGCRSSPLSSASRSDPRTSTDTPPIAAHRHRRCRSRRRPCRGRSCVDARPLDADAPPASSSIATWRGSSASTSVAPLSLRGRCGGGSAPLPLATRVVAVADFQNDAADALTAAMSYRALATLCGGGDGRSRRHAARDAAPAAAVPDAAAAAIRGLAPSLYVVTNEQLVDRFGRIEFSYFRQLSSVLTTVTLFFGLLLVAVLLTVSVNQQLGEIAALRALGLSRARVMAGVFCESLLLIGIGGAGRRAARHRALAAGSTRSCARCPAFPPTRTSSSSRRARSSCTPR